MEEFVLEDFGGLDLMDPTNQVPQGAIDTLNVQFDRPGRVRTRDGGSSVATLTATSYGLWPIKFGSTSYMLSVGASGGNAYLDRWNGGASVTAVGNWAAASLLWPSVAILGTTTTTYAYVATLATLRKYDGTTLSTSSGKPKYVAVTPLSNRLVQGSYAAAGDTPSGANGSISTVFLSNPGDPETYGANNYVTLHPGDGEGITGMATWRDLLFVFKETTAYVFYGESTDSTGNPVFNYRTISLPSPVGRGILSAGAPVLAVAPDGVYFIANDGVYRTTGGQPVLVSPSLSPLFQTPQIITGLWAGAGNVLFYATISSSDYVYVLDSITGKWSTWQFANSAGYLSGFTGWPFVADRRLFYTAGTSLLQSSSIASTDNGTAIVSRYRTGFLDLGQPETEKAVRELILDGTGAPTVKTAKNMVQTYTTGSAVTLGTSPTVGQGRVRSGTRGRSISVDVGATSGAWSLERLVLNVQGRRSAGVKST